MKKTIIIIAFLWCLFCVSFSVNAAAPVMNTTNITPSYYVYANTGTLVGDANASDADNDLLDYYYSWYKNGATNISGSTMNNTCYQETATDLPGCSTISGSNQGAYSYTDAVYWRTGYEAPKAYDGDWSTAAVANQAGRWMYQYYNYSVPIDAQSAKLRLKLGSSGTCTASNFSNFTIPSDCLDNTDNVLQARIMVYGALICGGRELFAHCWNGSSWNQITFLDEANTIYEEAVLWDLGYNESLQVNIANLSSVLLNKNENWTLGIIANDGSSNSSEMNATVTVLNSLPIVHSLQILPIGAQSDQNIFFSNVTTDLDNDTITSSNIFWYKNEVRQTALDNASVVLAGNTSLGEEWLVNLAVFDGENWSTIAGSPALTMGDNTSPSFVGDTLSSTSGINDEPFVIRVNVTEVNSLAWVKVQVTDPNGLSFNYSMSPGNASGLQSKTYTPSTDGFYTFVFYAQDGSGNSGRFESDMVYVETTAVGGAGGTSGGTSESDVEELIEDWVKGYVSYAFPGDIIKIKWLPVEEDYTKEVIITANGGDVSATVWFSPGIKPFFSAEICDLYTLECSDTVLIEEGEQKYVKIIGDFGNVLFEEEFSKTGMILGSMVVLSDGDKGPYSYNISISKHVLFDKSLEYKSVINEKFGSSYTHKAAYNLTVAGLGILALACLMVFGFLLGII